MLVYLLFALTGVVVALLLIPAGPHKITGWVEDRKNFFKLFFFVGLVLIVIGGIEFVRVMGKAIALTIWRTDLAEWSWVCIIGGFFIIVIVAFIRFIQRMNSKRNNNQKVKNGGVV